MPGVCGLLIWLVGAVDAAVTSHRTDNLATQGISPHMIPSPRPPLLEVSLLASFLFLVVKWFCLCCCLSQPLGERRWSQFPRSALTQSVASHTAQGRLLLSALLITSIWHCVSFMVFTSPPSLCPVQLCLPSNTGRKISAFCQMLNKKSVP